MMCALVIGGNGRVAMPPSADSTMSSSITAGIISSFVVSLRDEVTILLYQSTFRPSDD